MSRTSCVKKSCTKASVAPEGDAQTLMNCLEWPQLVGAEDHKFENEISVE